MKEKQPLTQEQKFDKLLRAVEQMNRRDRMRTNMGFFESFLRIGMILAFIYSMYYGATHFDEILAKVSKEAAKQVTAVAGQGTSSAIESLNIDDLRDKLGEMGLSL